MCTLPACRPDHSRFGRAWGQTAVLLSPSPFPLFFLYCFVITSLQRTASPAFHGLPVAAAFFLFCASTYFAQYRFIFPVVFVLFYLIFLWRTCFFNLFC